ncbi:hypothetical protein [Peribacillus sp. NPDC097895]|uniref:hypothetical protein n=1 Tax=Peribacillus sp. NPDC097895 TaxID=3390619 RepID=UPI003D0307C9
MTHVQKAVLHVKTTIIDELPAEELNVALAGGGPLPARKDAPAGNGDLHAAPKGTLAGGGPLAAPKGALAGGGPLAAPKGALAGGGPLAAPKGALAEIGVLLTTADATAAAETSVGNGIGASRFTNPFNVFVQKYTEGQRGVFFNTSFLYPEK